MSETETKAMLELLKEISITSLRIEKLIAHIIDKAEKADEHSCFDDPK